MSVRAKDPSPLHFRMTPTSALILALFATIWWVAGTHAAHAASTQSDIAGLLLGAWLMLGAALRRRRAATPALDPAADRRRGRTVGIASAAEGVAILVAVNVAQNLHRTDLVVPAIAIIVG